MTRQGRLRQKSSAHDLLRGTTYNGKRISGVYRGPGAERRLTFDRGGHLTVHRSEIAELAQVEGARRYRRKYRAASRAEKRRMLAVSEARQRAIKRNWLARRAKLMADVPVEERKLLASELRRVRRKQFGSIHVGKTPASSLHSRAGQAFAAAKRAGARWVTVRRQGKTRRILVG